METSIQKESSTSSLGFLVDNTDEAQLGWFDDGS